MKGTGSATIKTQPFPSIKRKKIRVIGKTGSVIVILNIKDYGENCRGFADNYYNS